MGMGIVSDSDFAQELNRVSKPEPITTSNSPNITKTITGAPSIVGEVLDAPRPGRTEGATNVPEGLRKLIGEESAINGRQSAVELASQFGLSPSSVSAYANGSTSTASYDRRPNLPHINDAKVRVQKRARVKLMAALANITGDKLQGTNAKDLSGIAKDMSAVIRNMEPEADKSKSGDSENGPKFVIYSPQFRDERHFETVIVKE